MMLRRVASLIGLLLALSATVPAHARDVAFIEPGSGGGSATPDEAFKIEPKAEIDIGDSIINIVRRQTLFLVNQTSAPVKFEKITVSSDSTVAPQIVNDDCSKQASIPPLSRCSIELTVTPTGPGAWGIELLMTHNGPGRITRAKIIGKTAGSDASDKKDRGLFLSSKDTKAVEFGEVTIGEGKVVRSALMVNDSPSPITIFSVDVIEADKSLQRLEQGCAPDMDLKPGESCPVTLVWTPTSRETISTDLIIRHSGQLGFAVIPVRGTAKGSQKDGDKTAGDVGSSSKQSSGGSRNDSSIPSPPSPNEIAREVAKAVTPVRSDVSAPSSSMSIATGSPHLIGTVGNRIVLLKPDGTTAILQVGEQVDLGGEVAKVEAITPNSTTLLIGGKKKELLLEAVQELKDRALASQKENSKRDVGGTGGKDNASGGGKQNAFGGIGGGLR